MTTTAHDRLPGSGKPRYRLRANGVVEPVLPRTEIVAYFRDGVRIPVSAEGPSEIEPVGRGGVAADLPVCPPEGADAAMPAGSIPHSRDGASELGESAGSKKGNGGLISRPAPGGVEALTPHSHSRDGASDLASGSSCAREDARPGVCSSLNSPPGPRAPAAFSGVRIGDHDLELPPFLDRRDAASRAFIEAALATPSTREGAPA